jgi:hypothetical protein
MKTNPNHHPFENATTTIGGLRSMRLFAIALFFTLLLPVACSKDDDEVTPAELTITSITPDSGSEGTIVQIKGTGFSATASENQVNLNGKACPVANASATQLTITIPAAAGTGKIVVKVAGKTAESTTFTFEASLAITSITPTTGAKETEVVLKGTGFSTTASNNTVTINDKACTVTNATATQLTIVIPSGAGTGPIQVTVNGNTVESTTFTYILTTTVSTLAGGTNGFADGDGSVAQFDNPYNVATDANGNIYVADASNHKIRKITAAGVVSTLAGSTQGDADGTGAAAQFNYPYGIATDVDGNVYVADTYNHKVKKITPAGVVTTLAGSTSGYTDATGGAAQFSYLTGVTVDDDGNVYVSDKDNHKIRKITPAGQVSTLAGSSSGFADGTGAAAQFNSPYDVAVDADGNVFVADASNHKIRKVTSAGVVTTLAGSTQGDADGTGAAAQFYYPFGVATDADGTVYVADTYNHKVKKVTTGGVVTTFAGSSNGYSNGEASASKFNYLTGIDFSVPGIMYIADKDNHKVRKITLE